MGSGSGRLRQDVVWVTRRVQLKVCTRQFVELVRMNEQTRFGAKTTNT